MIVNANTFTFPVWEDENWHNWLMQLLEKIDDTNEFDLCESS